jgi:hypothetical protein
VRILKRGILKYAYNLVIGPIFLTEMFRVGLSSQVLESELSENVCGSISSEIVAHMEGLELDTGFSLFIVGKMILPNTQSINRL